MIGTDRAGHLQRPLRRHRGAKTGASTGVHARSSVTPSSARDAGALFLEFLQRRIHPLARELVDRQGLDARVFAGIA